MLDHIRCFGPDIIVVALGLDAAISDPFKGLSITTEGFGKIANNIGKLGKPLAIVQEGEYLGPELGLNLTRFLKAIKA